MEHIIIVAALAVIFLCCAAAAPLIKNKLAEKRETAEANRVYDDANLIKTLLSLDKESLDELLLLYKNQFGRGAGRYAQNTFKKWQAGEVRPNRQTFERFLIQLPTVMSYDLKCEVLRRLMEEFCSKNDYNLTVFTDDWEQTLEPMVTRIIDNSYTVELPRIVEEKLEWLANGEMQTAQKILRQTQIEESRIAVSMLRSEMNSIENLLAATKGKSRVTHQLKFPYGTITLEIKKR